MYHIGQVSEGLWLNLNVSSAEKFDNDFAPILRLIVTWRLPDSPRKNQVLEGAFRVELKATHFLGACGHRRIYNVINWERPKITIIQGHNVSQRAEEAAALTFHELRREIYERLKSHENPGGVLLRLDEDGNWYSDGIEEKSTFSIEKEVKAGSGLMNMSVNVELKNEMQLNPRPDENDNNFEF